MEILDQKRRQELKDYLPHVRESMQSWLFVDLRLTPSSDKDFTNADTAELMQAIYPDKEGKIYICDDREIIMLLKREGDLTARKVAKSVEECLPAGSCEVHVYDATHEKIATLEMLITVRRLEGFSSQRYERREKILLVADDDNYMRLLVKKGASDYMTVHEVTDGALVLEIYKKLLPDILLLDIHLPNMLGTHVLRTVLAYDPSAYIVMLSSDSSVANVKQTAHQGAAGFLTKPFTKEKLLQYIKKCPTISLPPSG